MVTGCEGVRRDLAPFAAEVTDLARGGLGSIADGVLAADEGVEMRQRRCAVLTT